MRIAIYSRKSKVTETGDSINNQINMCRDYADKHFSKYESLLYEDEGFSGGNTERPMFQKLLKDVSNKKVDILICYRLDRISRNVADFSETLELLNQYNVGFISIKEQFDTTSPMGRAMMYIASVFAQLERDTIAERITDNLSSLAKTGRFLGWKPPEGYKKKRITSEDDKVFNVLEQDESETERVKLIFKRYLEWQSIKKLETYCLQNDLKTRNGFSYRCVSLRRILIHPMYAVADMYTYDYFKSLGVQIVDSKEKFDGSKGITVFKRTKGTKRGSIVNDYCEWILGVGSHQGIISSTDWINVQNIIEKRKSLTIRRPIGKNGLLSGILRCAKCGDYMRPFSITNGRFYYICSTKETSKKQKCDIKNIRGDILDKEITSKILDMISKESDFFKKVTDNELNISKRATENQVRIKKIKKDIKDNEESIKNLVMRLSKQIDSVIEQYITEQVNELDVKNRHLKAELSKLEDENINVNNASVSVSILKDAVEKIKSHEYEQIDEILVKRNLLKTLIQNIHWDGENISIEFHK